ncbi:uncharacterized protein PG998_008968 [Apiospora kogelbergensis]|uniref:uncharacterized protein n=1 Tax=Apiospora kogelbergensis TaxID=1337665 RepID=UPI00312E22E6
MEHTPASPTQPAPAAVPQQPQKQHGAFSQHHQQSAQPSQQLAPYYAYGASPRVIPFDKNWYWAKLALTIASIVFSIILLGLGLGISLRPMDSYYSSSYAWIVIPLVIVCVVWDLAELITLFTCGRRRKTDVPQQAQQQDPQQQQKQETAHDGIHPGAHVGVDLVLWLAGIVVLLFSISSSIDGYDMGYGCNSSYYTSSSYYRHYCNADYQNALKNFYRPAHRAALAFICLLIITHFVIFVRACIEVNQRNRMRGPVIMVPSSHMSMYIVPGQQQAAMMPMMPAQTHMAPASEKAAGSSHPQSNAAPAEGFYGPGPSPSTGHAGQAV